jgi:hypothetical protein
LAGVSQGYLADACALITFFLAGPMGKAGQQAMADGDVAVSSITVWEITRTASLGKLPDQWGEGGGAGVVAAAGVSAVAAVMVGCRACEPAAADP